MQGCIEGRRVLIEITLTETVEGMQFGSCSPPVIDCSLCLVVLNGVHRY